MEKLFTMLLLFAHCTMAIAQTYTMQNGTFNTCSGTFYDSGGATGNYTSNENYTITFCPDTPGDSMQLTFTDFLIEGFGLDVMTIYNGDNTGEPIFGVYDTSPGQLTANNVTGCITISFVSDTGFNLTGWAATISCVTPCQTITASLDSVSIPPNADNIIEMCVGDTVSVTGSGVFSNSGAGATYDWNFGDGNIVTGTTANHSYTAPGVYVINLLITDNTPEACTNTNNVNLIAHVYGTPNFNNLAPPTICLGSQGTINASATGLTFAADCAPPIVGTTFLPDGDGAVYSTCINVSCYDPLAVVTSASDIIDICLNMEHSYFGDLDIIIIAPNGQQAVLVDYNLTNNNSTYLGEPNDDADTNVDLSLGPGVGYDYCFSMSGTVTLDNAPTVNGGDSFAAGTYLPDESFASLIGSPLNGQWCIQVQDNLLLDNGYIFSWGISFAPSFAPPSLSYTQTIVSDSWQADPDIVSASGGDLTIDPVATGSPCYTYEVVDNTGCTHTKQYCATVEICSNTIDFDGTDDYINTPAFMGGLSTVSMMSWIKLDNAFNGGEIMGQRNFRLYVDASNRLKAYVRTDSGTTNSATTPNGSAPTLNTELWYHVAAIYDGNNGTVSLFLNGEEVWQAAGLTGSVLNNNATWNANHDFEIGRNTYLDTDYFEGDMDESRVYNVALTAAQLQEQIYQRIENNGGTIRGLVTGKDITGLNWNNLLLYYHLDNAAAGTTPDTSVSGTAGTLNNMLTAQDQTAPLPFIANNAGAWANMGTWQHGTVWDIATIPHKDWAIVHVTNNAKVTAVNNHSTLGLLIDGGAELEMQNDTQIQVSSYLRLDGQLDLQGESQLVQSIGSDLDVQSAGFIERDQQGKAEVYSYNYWSSPVSPQNTTANNTDYSVSQVLFDGTDPINPLPITFSSTGYDGTNTTPITIADYWIFKFVNQPDDYGNWFNGHIRSTGTLSVGEGYTQKGSGTTALSQNYVFKGKPNNGTIQLTVGANNLYLVGNPYPSAIDGHKFIADNVLTVEAAGDVIGSGTSTGALYFWEHWGGNSHALAEYQGGFATMNLAGGTIAIPDPDVSVIGGGTVIPQRYIAVGQGFFVQGSPSGGVVEFNNSQRVFEREIDGNSVFIKTSQVTPIAPRPEDDIERMYFRFTTPEGPQRQLLLALKEGLTQGIDYGYDAPLIDHQLTDCYWKVEEERLVIQSIGSIEEELELPLEIKMGNEGVCKFEAEDISGLPTNVTAYFVDELLEKTTRLVVDEPVVFELTTGDYEDRFFIKFKVDEKDEIIQIAEDLIAYYLISERSIILESQKAFTASDIRLYNLLGQQVYQYDQDFNESTRVSLPTNLNTGVYLVKFVLNNAKEMSKRVIIK